VSKGKKHGRTARVERAGVLHCARVVNEMKHIWRERPISDVGVDGDIEIVGAPTRPGQIHDVCHGLFHAQAPWQGEDQSQPGACLWGCPKSRALDKAGTFEGTSGYWRSS
jgi:hypothetical protein